MTMVKKQYSEADFKVGSLAKSTKENGVISHTHVVKFGRPPTEAERLLFRTVLSSFCQTMRFSPQFGGEFVAEPTVDFIDAETAHYTFRQKSLSGDWKELLFSILANFSAEIVPILRHDESTAFDPTNVKVPV